MTEVIGIPESRAGMEDKARAALADLRVGPVSKRAWVTLTKRDGKKEVRILPQHLANELMYNLSAGCDPEVASATIVQL